jgi:hypothetical protein
LWPLLFLRKWALIDFREILEIARTKKLIFGQKKWAKARFCEPKVGRKNRVHFLKTALFWRFLTIFGRFAQIGC